MLHTGVSVEAGRAFDSARRTAVDTQFAAQDEDRTAAALVSAGYAHLDHDAADRARLLIAVWRERSLAPFRVLRLGFARRHAQRGALAVPWQVLMAARLPLLLMTLGIGGVGVLVGLLTGDLGTPLRAAAGGILVCAVSMVGHESAHLLTLRGLAADRTAGAIEHSWVNVWIVGPHGGRWHDRVTALAGPLAGMLACLALAQLGVQEWICWAVGITHAANLFPLAPDGRMIFSPSGRRSEPAPAAPTRRTNG